MGFQSKDRIHAGIIHSCPITVDFASQKEILQRRRRRIVQAGERFVEQSQPRIVNQGALERDALPHAT